MKQFTKISLVTILSFIGVILTVMFKHDRQYNTNKR